LALSLSLSLFFFLSLSLSHPQLSFFLIASFAFFLFLFFCFFVFLLGEFADDADECSILVAHLANVRTEQLNHLLGFLRERKEKI
jgi:Ca2+/Na+ antiporter